MPRSASAMERAASSRSLRSGTAGSRPTMSWSMPSRPRGRRMPEGAIEVVDGVEGLRPEHGPLFAVIGVFDGIHLGHRYLLGRLVEEARRRGARPSVITFDSHPDEILVGAAPPLLLDPVERVRMLGE